MRDHDAVRVFRGEPFLKFGEIDIDRVFRVRAKNFSHYEIALFVEKKGDELFFVEPAESVDEITSANVVTYKMRNFRRSVFDSLIDLVNDDEERGGTFPDPVDLFEHRFGGVHNVFERAERVEEFMRGFVHVFARNGVKQKNFEKFVIGKHGIIRKKLIDHSLSVSFVHKISETAALRVRGAGFFGAARIKTEKSKIDDNHFTIIKKKCIIKSSKKTIFFKKIPPGYRSFAVFEPVFDLRMQKICVYIV